MRRDRRVRFTNTVVSKSIWRWNAALLAIVFLQLSVSIVAHKSRTELEVDLWGENPESGVRSLFVLTNRDRPAPLDEDQIEELIASNNPLLREWVFTTNFSRMLSPRDQANHLQRLGTTSSDQRARFYFEHGIGKAPWLSLAELDEYLDGLDE